ncbi:hypothetical protein OTU49_002250 [Cherax quadricarinatus]|uniref:DNA repair protein complementing XP-G cells n=1 Tax=Cherax quadricarinatus TaxID=27406 RepID=A0AAW0XC64_CHEQU
MGVKGLWKLIERAGVPVPLETLEHKILAVDVSIWLHQAVKGFRGPGGANVANAHLLTLFHRICKLLFYRIRPVFVFDGGVPYLKKQTLASRKLRRDVAASKAKQVRERLLKNLLKSQAVRKALGRAGPGPNIAHVVRAQKKEKDMFELPPLSNSENGLTSLKSEDSEDEGEYILRNFKLPNLHQFNFESNEFKSLSIEAQHEILSELQDTRKQNSWSCINEMPQESENFAEFQMGRLIKRRTFQATLDSTREEIRKRKAAEMEAEMFGELEKHVSLSQRIISEDDAHSVFVKKIKANEELNDNNFLKEDKGKSPMKRPKKAFEKDFLTELAKQGVVRSYHSDSDNDDDDICYELENSDKDVFSGNENEGKRLVDIEEEGFLHIVSTLMENSGLTQQEILAMIKQDSSNQSQLEHKPRNEDVPSTSDKAPGFVFNPDAESSDDDGDFIEVSEASSQHSPKSSSKDGAGAENTDKNNLDKLLSTKTDSLWMKIIHQKLDDLVHTNAFNTSPKKASLDSRKLVCKEVKKDVNNGHDIENLKAVKISLDFDVKPLKMEDDIFADIFTDINKPISRPVLNPQKNYPASKIKITKQAVKNFSKRQNEDRATNGTIGKFTENGKTNKELSFSQHGIDSVVEDSVSGTCNKISTLGKLCTDYPNIISTDAEISSVTPEDQRTDESFQTKINELVNLKVEELVKNASQQNKVVFCKSSNSGEQDLNDVELMSSSDDSDSDESHITKSQLEPSKNPGLNVHDDTLTTDSRVLLPSDIDVNDTDLVVLKESHKNDLATKTNCDVKQKSSHVQQEIEACIELIVEQQSNQPDASHINSLSVTKLENNREDVSEKKHFKDQSDFKNSEKANTDYETYESSLDTVANDPALESLNETVERPQNYSKDELKCLEKELASEQETLVAQAQKSDRIASNLNDQMYGESQKLLQLFGIPYLVAPMEAEAQCAFLESVNLSAGTITDDSDIFLFGGSKVYKNFFNQTKHVEFFNTGNIEANLGLDRHKMISLALLTGSDYTEGVESIGSVTAMEVLAEFPGESIECLRNLKKWWNTAHKNVTSIYASKVKQRLSHVMLPESFPNERVYEAYLKPDVDESREKFTWAVPNVEALRTFIMEKFGWNLAKVDEILIPVMKKLGVKASQMRIDSYFTSIKLVKEPKITSKRVQDAIAKAKGQTSPNSSSPALRDKLKKFSTKSKSEKKRRKVMDPDGILDEISEKVSAGMDSLPGTNEPSSSKPSRTLLMDPSESSSNVVELSKRKRKYEKKSKNCEGSVSEETSSQKSSTVDDIELQPPRKLTKEIMYKALLEKETISQRECDKKMMEERKEAAAQLLKKQNELRKRHRR